MHIMHVPESMLPGQPDTNSDRGNPLRENPLRENPLRENRRGFIFEMESRRGSFPVQRRNIPEADRLCR